MSSRGSASWKLGLGLALALGGCMQADYGDPVAVVPDEMQLQAYDAFAGELPSLILDAWLAQARGKSLNIELQRQLYKFGREHTDDPRPWILLARDSMQRGWAGFAVSQYGLALRADPHVTGEPGVLSDVLQIAVYYTGVEESDANALLVDYWGAQAIPAIDRARAEMQASGHDQLATKLDAMRESILQSARSSDARG